MDGMSESNIRIGNEERAAAMRALDEHMSAGRLDPDEYGQRYAQASVARTREGLDELFTDLPEPHPFPAAPAWSGTPASIRRPAAFAQNAMQRYAGESAIARVAMIALAALVIIVVLPFLLTGALLLFVVLPMLACRGFPGRYRVRRW
jgi:hypothetical protein